jgi:hypothetical protein
MRMLTVGALFVVIACAASASCASPAVASDPAAAGRFDVSSLRKLDSVEMPAWSLHLGICRYPGLNDLQNAKEKIRRLQRDIERQERSIAAKRAEMERILAGAGESRGKSLFLLGLYARSTCVQDLALVYDEKSILWGAVKWGKRKPQI